MADLPESKEPSRPGADPVRRAAMRGALVASVLLIMAAAARGRLDVWLLIAAAAGVILSGLIFAGRTRNGQLRVTSDGGLPQRPGTAEALLATIPDPVILVDRRAVVIEMNEAARVLLPALKLKNPLSFALRSPDVLDGIEEVLRIGDMRKVEYSERVPTERTFEVQIGPLRADSPQSGVVLFFRDLTSARRLEHMRVDFVANASHELRTPLASLLGFIETLQGPARNDPTARERFLEIMRAQAQRMTRLIDDLLSLSRIEMRVHVPPEKPVDLAPILTQIVDALTPMARERSVAIGWRAPDRPVMVLGDRDELLRVAENLIENAVKYGEGGGRVDVTLAQHSGSARSEQVELTVRDYGPGIAPEHLPRLTERFYRADVAQSREKGGTGLGLAIVKHIVNRHRGHLTIESTIGEGTLVKVALPGTNAHRGVTP
jgi:two-component system, OmpR family, phosphate regulon sensor histidine kinase PhoR